MFLVPGVIIYLYIYLFIYLSIYYLQFKGILAMT